MNSAKKEQQRIEIQERQEKQIEAREHNHSIKQEEIQKLVRVHLLWERELTRIFVERGSCVEQSPALSRTTTKYFKRARYVG